jgi:hypothetical protein
MRLAKICLFVRLKPMRQLVSSLAATSQSSPTGCRHDSSCVPLPHDHIVPTLCPRPAGLGVCSGVYCRSRLTGTVYTESLDKEWWERVVHPCPSMLVASSHELLRDGYSGWTYAASPGFSLLILQDAWSVLSPHRRLDRSKREAATDPWLTGIRKETSMQG